MSNNSDSDEFFDAEDPTSSEVAHTSQMPQKGSPIDTDKELRRKENIGMLKLNIANTKNQLEKDEEWSEYIHRTGRHKFKELRQRMQTEEEDGAVSNSSPVDSQVSSVEDVFAGPSSKMLHPFRVIEHDTMSIQSMTSLGRIGRILSGASDSNVCEKDENQLPSGKPSDGLLNSQKNIFLESEQLTNSPDNVRNLAESSTQNTPPTGCIMQEPDVIASTKSSNNHTLTQSKPQNPFCYEQPPVAPPRRKRKAKTIKLQESNSGTSLSQSSSSSTICKENVSAETTIENLTRALEHSLDIKLASSGQYVVKPQDEDDIRAVRHNSYDERKQTVDREKMVIPSIITNIGSSTYPLKPLNTLSSITRNSSTYPLSSIGSHSMRGTRAGLGLRLGVNSQQNKERRKSTGDEQQIPHQLNMFVRTRTDSGKQLTDMEILEQVTVLNLDTGERVPLSTAEDKLPQCVNPLSLHIMRLTSEYVSNSSLQKPKESDEESTDSKKSLPRTRGYDDEDQDSISVVKRTAKLKKFLGLTVRKTVSTAKTIALEVSHVRHKDDVMEIKDEVSQQSEPFKLRASNSHKGPYEFQSLQYVQELGHEHEGPVWCMKFSSCGRLLATAGRDRILRIWVLRNAYTYFQEMRTKYNAEKVSPTPSQESLVSQQSSEDRSFTSAEGLSDDNSPFMPKPFCTYTGHTSDLLDLAWSKNYFVLSSSMDKTVRLWHISRKECLCCFQHIDFVTAICFHPRDDRYFLSGSLDGKLRLWNIPDKKVAVWNEVDGPTKLITAANFCQNGKFAVVGSYDGRCIFYNTDQLRYHTQIHVRSTRGKNSRGRKITGIEPMPGEDKILVTSNDSRIRLYDLIDLNLSCKYKGYVNVSSQIKASFSHDGKFIICGSENQCIYLWKTHHDYSKFPSVRRDRNDFWEGIKAHNAVVTCAVFAPNPDAIFQQIEENKKRDKENDTQSEDVLTLQHAQPLTGYVIVSADFNGCIRVFLNRTKPKHSSLPASALA